MDTTLTGLLPPAGSTIAPEVDAIFKFLFYASIFFIVIIYSAIIYFVVRYRRKKGVKPGKTAGPSHSTALELTWMVIPLILVIIVFVWGFKSFMRMSVVPKDAMEIKVTGQKWFWSFDYPEGVTTVNTLVVPINQPVKLLMSSKDVIHSFFVPSFRVKRDVLPNRYTIAWFEATQLGETDLFCAEYCGSKHSEMIGKVKVVSDREYKDWLETQSTAGEGLTPRDFGARLYVGKGCSSCHSMDGTPGNGPSFLGVYNHQATMKDGSTILVDENYLRESILEPATKIVAGYQPIMPTYQMILKDREVDALITYIKSLEEEL
jgi:cytochrome c oxidase subunit 2